MLRNLFGSRDQAPEGCVQGRKFALEEAGADPYKKDLITISRKAVEILPQYNGYNSSQYYYDPREHNNNFIAFNVALGHYLKDRCSKKDMDRYKEILILEGLKGGMIIDPRIDQIKIRFILRVPNKCLSAADILTSFISSQIQKRRISAEEAFKLLTAVYDTGSLLKGSGANYREFVMLNVNGRKLEDNWSNRRLIHHDPKHDQFLVDYITAIFEKHRIPLDKRKLANHVKESKSRPSVAGPSSRPQRRPVARISNTGILRIIERTPRR